MPVHETNHEQIQQFPSHKIIVIHPGSLYVRIGRASDLVPVKTLHCVARRRRQGGKIYRDPFVPPSVPKTKELIEDLEECRLQVSHTLQSCVQSNGNRRYATPPQQIAAFNRRSAPEVLKQGEPWQDIYDNVVVGDQVLDIDPEQPYNIHFPYRRGEFNLHGEIGGSVTSVLNDLYTIWMNIFEKKLNIQKEQLSMHRCVLIIPDIYIRNHVKNLVTLLLNDFGFGHCFVLQESVAASFGAGIGSACVVDIGDQKTSISCVEDGVSHKNTRLTMDYGAGDLCQTLSWMLHKSAFPYKMWNENIPRDVFIMRNLYEDFCHINLDICGPQEKMFLVAHPGEDVCRYTLQIGDESIISPLALFYTDLLKITGPKSTKMQMRDASDPEDPLDAEYLRETGRKREVAETSVVDPHSATADSANASQNDTQHNITNDEDIVVDALEAPVDSLAPDQVLSLDTAVLQSIDRCATDELKKKMYSSVVIVGGGAKMQGLSAWLQNKLVLQIPYAYRSEQVEIVKSPKDIDQSWTCWKGAAVMSCLESAVELWIEKEEWFNHGLRLLRERAPFVW